MINNPQNSQEKLGIVDDISSNSQIGETIKYLESNNKRPLDNSMPSLNVQEYAPGTILSEEYFNHSNSGVASVAHYSVNTVEQDEQRMRQVDKEATQGRSIYNAPPKSSGAPFISEEIKPTSAQLSQQVKQAQINSLTNKIKRYQTELAAFQMKVINAEIGLKKAKDQLIELESN